MDFSNPSQNDRRDWGAVPTATVDRQKVNGWSANANVVVPPVDHFADRVAKKERIKLFKYMWGFFSPIVFWVFSRS